MVSQPSEFPQIDSSQGALQKLKHRAWPELSGVLTVTLGSKLSLLALGFAAHATEVSSNPIYGKHWETICGM